MGTKLGERKRGVRKVLSVAVEVQPHKQVYAAKNWILFSSLSIFSFPVLTLSEPHFSFAETVRNPPSKKEK